MIAKRKLFSLLLAGAGLLFGLRSGLAAEPLTVRIGFASVGADNRQFSGGSSAAVAHSEHYLDQALHDRPDVKVEWYFFKGAGPAVNEAFANNQLDFAIQGDLPEIIGRANGLKTRILLASGAHAPIYLAVPFGSAIRKVADLRGRKVSIFRGTNNHLAAVKVLAGNGLQERDVQIINMDTATTNAALTSKDIDAAFGNFPLASLAEKNIAEIIYTTKGDNPAYERHSTLIGQDAFIKAHPDITQSIVSAIVRAARWASDEANREAFFEISARTGFPASGYRFDFSNQELKYRNTPIIDASIIESYRVQAKQAREFGLLRRDVDLNGWFDRSFLDVALKEQGLVGYWQEYDASGRPQAAGQ
ncbi:nitrate ABC transporter substrate-binding protein [Bradyrhizobium brasilense]|uniref:ABC transporter substrate-binding protein n=1 Tax=Bradyrhizobium brasilense TaxID=1419277 RepID=UPI0014573CA2|nr:ABC transporter substrate-binding protein [Bradyrhizobium brasilense]NLS68272.1 nitrate ABC transporter substrate-binding protein [Bradyrhizobium brasilense]